MSSSEEDAPGSEKPSVLRKKKSNLQKRSGIKRVLKTTASSSSGVKREKSCIISKRISVQVKITLSVERANTLSIIIIRPHFHRKTALTNQGIHPSELRNIIQFYRPFTLQKETLFPASPWFKTLPAVFYCHCYGLLSS